MFRRLRLFFGARTHVLCKKIHKCQVFDIQKYVFNAKNAFLSGFLARTNFSSEKWIFSAPAAVDWRQDEVF